MIRFMAPVAASILTIAIACAAPAYAQSEQYPSRPIRLVVPFQAGVITDVLARTFAEKLSTRLGKPVLIENKPGAGGALGAKFVASADPDGYTLLFVNSQHAIAPAVYKALNYDTLTDFGVALVAESPSAVIVSPKIGARTLKAFIEDAKSKPETFTYASAGTGSQTHLAAEYFSSQAGIKLVHLPYHNTGSIIADMIAGRTHATFSPPGFLLGQIQSGDLWVLAVTSRNGMAEPINAPSVNETAIPGYQYSTWFGIFAPSRTPATLLERLADAFHAALNEPDLKEKFLKSAVITRFIPLREFDAFVKADIEKQVQIVKAAGITAQ